VERKQKGLAVVGGGDYVGEGLAGGVVYFGVQHIVEVGAEETEGAGVNAGGVGDYKPVYGGGGRGRGGDLYQGGDGGGQVDLDF